MVGVRPSPGEEGGSGWGTHCYLAVSPLKHHGFRCQGIGKPKGYQCEIDRQKSGMIYAIGSGWVWPRGTSETKRFQQMTKDAFKNDQWNKFRIRCEGERIQIWINGVQTADVRDSRFRSGSVALQHHGKGGLHRFRNIRK